MQSTSSLLRVTARLVVLALTSFVLVVLGCTGAQAFPDVAATTAIPLTAPAANSSVSGTGHSSTALSNTVVSSALAPTLDKPACIPGRDKTRIEQNAISAGQGLLPHQGGTSASTLLRVAALEAGLLPRPGRIPAALTHLDLGIVRT